MRSTVLKVLKTVWQKIFLFLTKDQVLVKNPYPIYAEPPRLH